MTEMVMKQTSMEAPGPEWKCYVMINNKDPTLTYIGVTCGNINHRMTEHNSRCLQYSNLRVAPWALIAAVEGFGEDKELAILFQQQWLEWKKCFRIHPSRPLTPKELVDLIGLVVEQFQPMSKLLNKITKEFTNH